MLTALFVAMTGWGGICIVQASQARKTNRKASHDVRAGRFDPSDWMCILVLVASLANLVGLCIDNFVRVLTDELVWVTPAQMPSEGTD